MHTLTCIAIALLAGLGLNAHAAHHEYAYPFSDPYTATVVGTPLQWQDPALEAAPLTTATLPRLSPLPLPEVFWYQDRLYYSAAWQPRSAPLIFVIGGTGAGHNAATLRHLADTWFREGYHVVTLSSPTYPNFIATASRSGVPGYLRDDAADLYAVMDRIVTANRTREIQHFSLTGYSLGGAHAAWVSQLDDQQQRFNFQRVLLINPPVSLYDSVVRLDRLLESRIDLEDPVAVDRYVTDAFDKVARVYVEDDTLAASDDLLYTLYKKLGPSNDDLSILIGTAFRLSSANMLFTADVMTDRGYIKPAGLELSSHSALTDYLKASGQISFVEYFEQFFLPFFQQHRQADRHQLLDELSLRPLTDYLRNNPHIHVMTNRDDIILSPQDLAWLQSVFGSRTTLFPTGGHLGNLQYPPVTRYLADVMEPTP